MSGGSREREAAEPPPYPDAPSPPAPPAARPDPGSLRIIAAVLSDTLDLDPGPARLAAVLFLADGAEIGGRELAYGVRPHRRPTIAELREMADALGPHLGDVRSPGGYGMSPEAAARCRAAVRAAAEDLQRLGDQEGPPGNRPVEGC